MMLIIFVINLPIFFIYGKYSTHKTHPLAILSLGNMGGAFATC